MIRGTSILLGSLCVAGLVLVGCPSPRSTPSEPEVRIQRRDRPFYEGTARMQTELDALVAEIPTRSAAERVDLARRIVSYGEPATPKLIAALEDPNASAREFAAWTLGLMRDPRALDALATALTDPEESVRYEAATTMVRLGDRRGLPLLVDGLAHPDPRVRGRSIQVLEQVTSSTFGYRPDDHKDDRDAAVARWRAWLAERGREGTP